jgi:hypothetical protein
MFTETVPLETWREETTCRTAQNAEEEEGGAERQFEKLHLRLNVFIVNTEEEGGRLSRAGRRHVTTEEYGTAAPRQNQGITIRHAIEVARRGERDCKRYLSFSGGG